MTDQENQPSVTFRGYVLFLPYAGGSKSESFRPVLATGHGTNLTLYRKGHNPFENESIRPFHGKFCEVAGDPDQERRLIELESDLDESEYPGVGEEWLKFLALLQALIFSIVGSGGKSVTLW